MPLLISHFPVRLKEAPAHPPSLGEAEGGSCTPSIGCGGGGRCSNVPCGAGEGMLGAGMAPGGQTDLPAAGHGLL